jgi:hypothetical protein
MEKTIKFGGYATKSVKFEHWPYHGYSQIESWGKTQPTSRGRIPLRILRDGIKTFCRENGIVWGESHAKAQAKFLEVVRKRNKSGMWV